MFSNATVFFVLDVIKDAGDVAPYRQSDTSPVLERLRLEKIRKASLPQTEKPKDFSHSLLANTARECPRPIQPLLPSLHTLQDHAIPRQLEDPFGSVLLHSFM